MDMFTMFFPEQAEAQNLKRIANQMTLKGSKSGGRADAGTLSLVLLSVIGSLIDKGVITHEDLVAQIKDLDALDGKADGKLSVDALRAKFELPKKKARKSSTKKKGIIRKKR